MQALDSGQLIAHHCSSCRGTLLKQVWLPADTSMAMVKISVRSLACSEIRHTDMLVSLQVLS